MLAFAGQLRLFVSPAAGESAAVDASVPTFEAAVPAGGVLRRPSLASENVAWALLPAIVAKHIRRRFE